TAPGKRHPPEPRLVGYYLQRTILWSVTQDMQWISRGKQFPRIQQNPYAFVFRQTAGKQGVLSQGVTLTWIELGKIGFYGEFVGGKAGCNKFVFSEVSQGDESRNGFGPGV